MTLLRRIQIGVALCVSLLAVGCMPGDCSSDSPYDPFVRLVALNMAADGTTHQDWSIGSDSLANNIGWQQAGSIVVTDFGNTALTVRAHAGAVIHTSTLSWYPLEINHLLVSSGSNTDLRVNAFALPLDDATNQGTMLAGNLDQLRGTIDLELVLADTPGMTPFWTRTLQPNMGSANSYVNKLTPGKGFILRAYATGTRTLLWSQLFYAEANKTVVIMPFVEAGASMNPEPVMIPSM